MRHGIEFVGDECMPSGRDFVLIQGDDWTLVVYRESAVCPQVLEESWAAYRAVAPDLLAAAM